MLVLIISSIIIGKLNLLTLSDVHFESRNTNITLLVVIFICAISKKTYIIIFKI